MGFSGREEEADKVRACPPSPIRIGKGAGLPFLLSLSRFLLLLLQLGKGGNLLLLGVGIPPMGAPHEAGPLPRPLLYIRGRGHPIDTQVDCLAVCSAPLHRILPRSYRCSA